MTVEILTFVALWCGNPMFVGDHYGTFVKRTHAQVDACREKLIDCIQFETDAAIKEARENPKKGIDIFPKHGFLEKCAKKSKLNE